MRYLYILIFSYVYYTSADVGDNFIDKGIIIIVPASKSYCFFHTLFLREVVELEYKVLEATNGHPYISFAVTDPWGRVIISDHKKPENSHRYNSTLSGNYKMCLDNTYSINSHKTVNWKFITEHLSGIKAVQ